MLDWLPPPIDLRAALRAAADIPSPAERFVRLRSLAQQRLDFLETIQFDRVLQTLADETIPGALRTRLAIVSSATVDHLKAGIRLGALRRGLLADVHAGAYGQFRQEILDPSSYLRDFGPSIILFSLTAREAIAGVPLAASQEEAHSQIDSFVEELRGLWQAARVTYGATLVQQTFLDNSECVFGSFERLVPGAPSTLIAYLNDRVAAAAAREGIHLLDIAAAAARDGRDVWFDVGRWLQAKQEIAPQAAPLYGELAGRLVAAMLGRSHKCLVLDLDNTLWGGVIGDDGLEGIVLGDGTASGEAHIALQRYARTLKERGIILAVCSKNEEEIALAAIEHHPEMLLRGGDFAVIVANWNDKAANLEEIAHRLNIGTDSLVFVDDNPVERDRVRGVLPMVAVPELPADPAGYARCIADAGYFETVSYTADDRARADQYAANASRETLRSAAPTMEEFLRGLQMSVTFGPFTAADLPRISQLINKTNQFNLTGRKYTSEQAAVHAAAAGNITLQFRLADRFGDNGLVSALILRGAAARHDVLELDTWVMSCRVFGRELEYEAMNIAVEAARRHGARAIVADYVPTTKNGIVGSLCEKLGFVRGAGAEAVSGATRWKLSVQDYVPKTTSIARREGTT
jgi:FkbH-like protein